MKVLWITNIVFPEAERLLDNNASLEFGGGWLVGSANILSVQEGVDLRIASVTHRVKNLTFVEGEHIKYYLLPKGRGNKRINHEYEALWIEINKIFAPDIVHIHGTEFSHGYAYLEACGVDNVCVSVQGLVSVCQKFYYAGLKTKQVISATTPVSLLLKMGIPFKALDYQKRGKIEIETLKRVKHVIGRTSWDKAHVWAINPNASYYHGGETLRRIFYEDVLWRYENCTPHRLFISQANYPIKGLHFLLEALSIVLRHYPDTTLYVAGPDITRGNSWKELLKLTDYGVIIKRLLKKYRLQNNVLFTGPLDAEKMRDAYLNCNVFVCPSSIENSPNSLAEAQILGVPVIASYVGGIKDMMRGEEENLYRFEEVEMLAFRIVQLFDLKDRVDTKMIRQEALDRHNPKANLRELLDIYQKVLKI